MVSMAWSGRMFQLLVQMSCQLHSGCLNVKHTSIPFRMRSNRQEKTLSTNSHTCSQHSPFLISSIPDDPLFTEPDRRTRRGVMFSVKSNLPARTWHLAFTVGNSNVVSMKVDLNILKDLTLLLKDFLRSMTFAVSIFLNIEASCWCGHSKTGDFLACICHRTYITLSHTWVFWDLLFSVASPLHKWMVHILNQRRTDKYNLPVLNNFIILLKKGAKYRWKCRYNFKMWQYSWTTKWICEGKLQILQWQKYLGSLLWPELSLVSSTGLYCFGDFSCPNAVNSIAWTWFRQMHSCLHELSARKKMVWSDRTRTWTICP